MAGMPACRRRRCSHVSDDRSHVQRGRPVRVRTGVLGFLCIARPVAVRVHRHSVVAAAFAEARAGSIQSATPRRREDTSNLSTVPTEHHHNVAEMDGARRTINALFEFTLRLDRADTQKAEWPQGTWKWTSCCPQPSPHLGSGNERICGSLKLDEKNPDEPIRVRVLPDLTWPLP